MWGDDGVLKDSHSATMIILDLERQRAEAGRTQSTACTGRTQCSPNATPFTYHCWLESQAAVVEVAE